MHNKKTIREIAADVKAGSFQMAALPLEVRNEALSLIAASLKDNWKAIQSANREDLRLAEESNLPQPILKRLKFDEEKLRDAVSGIESLIGLPDPLFQTLLHRRLDQGLTLRQVTCPIGVIGVIFESRPDALVQIASLCLKSGNCAVLKGGHEAVRTNRILFELIHQAGVSAQVPSEFLTLLESREEIDELLQCQESIDLLIPRGSNAFVRHIMEHSRIPVMGHSDGVCHIYADQTADMDLAVSVITDAKTQYVAACNTLETLLVHRDAAPCLLPRLKQALDEKQVALRGCERTRSIIPCQLADETDYRTEYVDYILSIKIVDSLDQAIDHINRYGSHHTDSILTEDSAAAQRFLLLVDSAGVYHNCSTRFADGFRYGFGAEVGISTGKLHARGPVGLSGLVTYKYRLCGQGQIVGDYASGKKQFHFQDLQ